MNNGQLIACPVQAIQKLMSSYCRFIDTNNWENLQDLFSQKPRILFYDTDGQLLYDFDSSEALALSAAQAIGNAVTLHQLHNPEITLLNDSEAEGIWAMEDRFYMPVSSSQPYFHGAGYYHVRFIFMDDRWQISELQLFRLRLWPGSIEV